MRIETSFKNDLLFCSRGWLLDFSRKRISLFQLVLKTSGFNDVNEFSVGENTYVCEQLEA